MSYTFENKTKPVQMKESSKMQKNQALVKGQKEYVGRELGLVQLKDVRDGMHYILQRKEKDLDILPYNLIQMKSSERQYGVIQRLDEDASDPYERGGESPKVHHIIPHSHLIDKYNGINSEATKTLVKKRFLPDANKLTIRQLGRIFRNCKFTYNGEEYKDDLDTILPWVDNPLDAMGGAMITGIGMYPTFKTVNEFITAYNTYKSELSVVTALTENKVLVIKELLDSYYLWPSGNLFYGPDHRIEPGGAIQNAFDFDAKYFKGEAHVDRLRILHNNLMSANGENEIRDALYAIADHTKNVGFGVMHEPDKWVNMQGDLKTAFLLFNSGTRESYLQTHDGILPKDFVRETLNGACKIDRDYIRIVHEYIENGKTLPSAKGGITFIRTSKKLDNYRTKIMFFGNELSYNTNKMPTKETVKKELISEIKSFILSHL